MRNEPDSFTTGINRASVERVRGWYRTAIGGVPAPAPPAPRLNGSVVLVILFVGAILIGLCAQWILRELGGLP